MKNENITNVTSELISEFYAPAAMSNENDDLLCTLSRKVQYQHTADENAEPATFINSFSLSAVMPAALGSDKRQGTFVLDCMSDALFLHHVAESVRRKFAEKAQTDSDVSVAVSLVIRSIDQATKDLGGLLDLISFSEITKESE